MKKTKKYFILMLAFLMIINSSVLAFADNKDKSKSKIYVEFTDDGIYELSESKGLQAKSVNDAGIYELKDGTLLSDTGTGRFQIVEKIEINLFDENEVNDLIERDLLEPEIEEDLLSASHRAKVKKNKESHAVIYLPISPEIKSTTVNYYTYGGYNLKDTIVDLYNQESYVETLVVGVDTKSTADVITDAFFLIGGAVSKTLKIFGDTKSLLDSMEDVVGAITGTSSSDYIESYLEYDIHTKYTSVDWGYGYETSMITQSAYVRKEIFDFHAVVSGGPIIEDTVESIYEWEESDDYDNPGPEAIINTGFVKNYRVDWEIYGCTFEF